MDERGLRLLRAVGPLVRLLLEDRRAAEDGLANSFALRRGFFLDLADEIGDLPIFSFCSSGGRCSQQGSCKRVAVSRVAKRSRSYSSPRRRALYFWVPWM